ncbi:MAG: DUF302 domain-containing protein [bacterium]
MKTARYFLIAFALFAFLPNTPATAAEGIIRLASSHSVDETVSKLETLFAKKGISLFARIDHQAAAKKVGVTLLPATLIIFGNPKLGSPLMHCQASVALDLPQKVLVSEDKDGQVWLSYNDPAYLASRHGIKDCEKPLAKISGALQGMAKAVSQ